MERNGKMYFNHGESSSWSKIFAYILRTGEGADLTLIARNGDTYDRFPVISTLVALRSDGLARIIDDLDPRAAEVVVPNVTSRVLKHVLNFIFTRRFKKGFNEEDIIELLKFNNDYPTGGLLEKCERILKNRLTITNVLNIRRISEQYNLTDVKDASLDLIFRNAKSIFATTEFLNIEINELSQLLESDDLGSSEIDIFNAILRWGTHHFQSTSPGCQPDGTQLRDIINTLIPLVRFPLMSPEEIAHVVKPSQVLTDAERLEIYDYISSIDDSKPDMLIFKTSPRVTPQSSGNSSPNLNQEPQVFDISSNVPATLLEVQRIHQSNGGIRIRKINTLTETLLNESNQNSLLSSSSSLHSDSAVSFVCNKQDHTFDSWESFVQDLSANHEDALDSMSTFMVKLKNVSLHNNYIYPRVVLKSLRKISLDLDLKFNVRIDTKRNDELARFEKSFDIRRYLFHRKREEDMDVKLEELWDTKMPINIVINGITMLRMNDNKKELAIGFRNDSTTILSGLAAGEQLLKLSLMKTDVPNFSKFPCKHLKELLFYHVWALSSSDVKEFVKKCSSLQSFCCWVICPWWENIRKSDITSTGQPLFTPTELDLAKDLVSTKLKHLSLCKVILTVPPKTIKNDLTHLFLDTCFWPASFADNFHSIFPNLKRCALIQKEENGRVRQDCKSGITVRMMHNIIQLQYIEWVRIWGMDWQERYEMEQKGTSKLLRSSICPISDEEVFTVKSFLESCNIRDDSKNFILERHSVGNAWSGEPLNELEPKEYDNGFWDRMDQLDFQYYKLETFFKDHQTLQNNFVANLELP